MVKKMRTANKHLVEITKDQLDYDIVHLDISEGGEFTEIVKKVLFQGKTMDQSVRFHMERELGDVLWYLSNACTALNINLQQVMEENERKLRARYPEGFSVSRSENRAEDDI